MVTAAITALAGAFGGGAVATAVAGAVVRGALSYGLSRLTARKRPGPGSIDTRQSLAFSSALPSKRFVYGDAIAQGTPIPWPAENGFIYAAWLLNSRESGAFTTLYLDGREVAYSGNPLDLSGGGATATTAPFFEHVTFWVSLGTQTAPPSTFTSEVPYDASTRPFGWRSTDAFTGSTVLWAKLRRGDENQLRDRWPSYPSVDCRARGRWSKVWDPRDPAQTLANKATHTFSGNQALCALDGFVNNPARPYGEGNIDAASWINAANVADEAVPLAAGGNESRYRVSGTIVYDGSEVTQLVQPLFDAGAASPVWIGGKLGIVPGAPRDSTLTIANAHEGSISFSGVKPRETVFDHVRCAFRPLELLGEPFDLNAKQVGAATTKDTPLIVDLGAVSSATQAQRIRNIRAKELVLRKSMRMVCFGETLDLVAGSVTTMGLPAPFDMFDGFWEVAEAHPGLDPVGENGVAMSVGIALTEHDTTVWDWTAATDEETVDLSAYEPQVVAVAAPTSVSFTPSNIDTGGTILPGVTFSFAPVDGDISQYEWQYAATGQPYSNTAFIDGAVRDGSGNVFASFIGSTGTTYKHRVRSISPAGVSDWTETTGVSLTVNLSLTAPTISSTTPSTTQITVVVDTPDDGNIKLLEVRYSETNDPSAATVHTEFAAIANAQYSTDITGLTASTLYYIFARTKGDFSNVSSWDTATETTTS